MLVPCKLLWLSKLKLHCIIFQKFDLYNYFIEINWLKIFMQSTRVVLTYFKWARQEIDYINLLVQT